jgi:translation initiation factor IF-1
MYNFVTSGIATEISIYKLTVAVDQNVSIQKAHTSGKIRKHRRKCVG